MNSRLRCAAIRALGAVALAAAPWQMASAAYPMQLGGLGADEVNQVVAASNGDVYVAGAFNETIVAQVNGVTQTLTHSGFSTNYDIFVARLDPAGQARWLVSVGGNGGDTAYALAVDADGHAYLGGRFQGAAAFGGHDLMAVGDANQYDGFVARFDAADGRVAWARRFGADGAVDEERVGALIPLPRAVGQLSGNVVVIGQASCHATFTGGATPLAGIKLTDADADASNDPTCDGRDAFVARLSAAGDWQWAFAPPGGTRSQVLRVAGGSDNGRAYLVRDVPPAGTPTTVFSEDFDNLPGYTAADTKPAFFQNGEIRGSWGPNFSISDAASVATRLRDYDNDNPNPSNPNSAEHFGQLNDFGSATSEAINTAGAAEVRIAVKVREGGRNSELTWDDTPDPDDRFLIEYLNASNAWTPVRAQSGGGGAYFLNDYSNGNELRIEAADARHAGFKLRFRTERDFDGGGYGFESYFNDSWHFDDIEVKTVSASPSRPTLLGVGSLNESKPSFAATVYDVPAKLDLRQLRLEQATGAIYLAGDVGSAGGAPWPDGSFCAGADDVRGATVFKFNGGGAVCEWATSATPPPPPPPPLPPETLYQENFDAEVSESNNLPGFALSGTRSTDGFPTAWLRLRNFDGADRTVAQLTYRGVATQIPAFNTAGAQAVRVSFRVWSGGNDPAWSERPDSNIDRFRVEYQTVSGGWALLASIGGGLPSFTAIDRTGAAAITISNPSALHAGFRLRFVAARRDADSFGTEGDFADSWLFDDVRIEKVSPPPPPPVSDSFVRGLAVTPAGAFLSGTFRGNLAFQDAPATLAGIVSHGAPAAPTLDPFVAQFGLDGRPLWLTGGNLADPDGLPDRLGSGASAQGDGTEHAGPIAVSPSGSDLFVGGWYSPAGAAFGPDTLGGTAGSNDGVVFNLRSDGLFYRNQSFVVGQAIQPPSGAKLNDFTYTPKFVVGGVEVDAIGTKLVKWVAPEPANNNEVKLIPLQPAANLRIRWHSQGSTLQAPSYVDQVGRFDWPTSACSDAVTASCHQLHVAGAPVDANPANGDYLLNNDGVIALGSGGASDGGRFTAPSEGWSTLVYVNGPTPSANQRSYDIKVVRSLRWDHMPVDADPGAGVDARYQPDAPATIGTRLDDAYDDEPGRTGFVMNEYAYYDGEGDGAAYNRAQRTGAIVPVNEYVAARAGEEVRKLAVAWYRRTAFDVYWPSKAVLYKATWPTTAQGLRRIVIASQLGSADNQPALEPGGTLYVQNDPVKPGFNPNDEHAFITASNTGSGTAAFALRSDFGPALVDANGNAIDQLAASEPYVLYRYFDTATQERRFHVYAVSATSAAHPSFAFAGIAGTTVSPPYPVRLMANCPESRIVGEAAGLAPPLPFFRDYKNQLWARSAGTGEALYHYPARADFYTDIDNVPGNDLEPNQCVPWLARLPVLQGGYGTPEEPIKVTYNIKWPDDPSLPQNPSAGQIGRQEVPLLTAGETLLTPKRGLPDIVNQAATEVVYDDLQDGSGSLQPPSRTVAQLMDPLVELSVSLKEVPASVASESGTAGRRNLLGSADLTRKLSATLIRRLSYDPLNKKLSIKGIYDPTSGAGEALLLPNVLSKRDRDALFDIDSGAYTPPAQPRTCAVQAGGAPSTCSWDEAVHALFRLSRNPQGIARICTNPTVNAGAVTCAEADKRAVHDDDVLVSFQDENGDTVLEPYQALGAGAALSAGASQGNGYLTLAFNNDPSLNPAPVSLSVIKVGCLMQGTTVLGPYQGQIQVIPADNVFDEQLTLRHSGDFGGNSDALDFEWFYAPPDDSNGLGPASMPPADPWESLIPPADQRGRNEISIVGANVKTLSDGYLYVRYKGLPQCGNSAPTFADAGYRGLFAGDPAATPTQPRPALGEGWVKRVLARLNPFEARVQNFATTAVNTYTSMLVQLGGRYEGPIALSSAPANLNNLGLIEAYTTVMRRAMDLSVNTGLNYDPANNAILLVASRLADFYTLLGNEAYADAEDPTIGVGASASDSLSLSPSIFSFQNQLDSLLSEELALLRGRDDLTGGIAARPVYNRLFWNFTRGDGEVAYANGYNITDQVIDGIIDEKDARVLYPQGHGDAWGHYLTATKIYYGLLRHPNYVWNPRAEGVLVAGTTVPVDYLDERQFAETAAAKARTGANIVDLTYRSKYVEDPAGQWQGYEDTNRQRAWGLAEWGKRAGQGAYFDWLTVNAIVPAVDPDTTHEGIQKIERRTIYELDEIAGSYAAIQGQVDKADAGLNPLGLAKGVVSFDIDPSQLERFNKTQFEQVYDRAITALKNAKTVWDFANQLNNQLRRSQITADNLYELSVDQETDFNNQLIEIFGYPYADDIGAGKTYPDGYDGPDLYHYNLVDMPELAGTALDFDGGGVTGDSVSIGRYQTTSGEYKQSPNGVGFYEIGPIQSTRDRTGSGGVACSQQPFATGCPLGERDDAARLTVNYTSFESPDAGIWFTKDPSWTGQRRAPGRIQQTIQQMIMGRIALKRAQLEYDHLRKDIEAQGRLIVATFNTNEANIRITDQTNRALEGLNTLIVTMKAVGSAAEFNGELLKDMFEHTSECIPKVTVVGLAVGGDLLAGVRCSLKITGGTARLISQGVAIAADAVANASEAGKERLENKAALETRINEASLELYGLKGELDALVREEPLLRSEIFERAEAIKQLAGDYYATLAEGQRVADRLVVFRRNSAAEVQGQRYRDMAYRIFRNDALAKYRGAFDLAARYVYLAASAYDYETNLGGADAKAGQAFLTSVVRERSIGQMIAGEPLPGSPGLADTMARLKANFDVLKGQMGFNNPQTETNRFSLRRELFRIPDGPEGDAAWREKLKSLRVDNLWRVPEFRRYARPFAPESSGAQPGLVIMFDTDVTFGLNYFGWELGPQDSSYDSSQFATRIRSVGAWFKDYAGLPLADDPRIYLFPVGADVLRSPNADNFATREWQVVDQAIPVPFPIGNTQLANFAWNPLQSLSGSATELRRYARFRAYNYAEPFNDAEVTADSRLIGRSVWNRKWMLIIPGGTFLSDADAGLDTFIDGRPIPGETQRDGDGVDDIYIFFKTYAYSGQ